MPQSRLEAIGQLEWWAQRRTDAYRRYAAAKREYEQVSGELAIVIAISKGEFDDDDACPTHAVGSRGAWPLDLDARYSLTALGRTACRS